MCERPANNIIPNGNVNLDHSDHKTEKPWYRLVTCLEVYTVHVSKARFGIIYECFVHTLKHVRVFVLLRDASNIYRGVHGNTV